MTKQTVQRDYDPGYGTYSGLTVEYTVATKGDRWFIPVNAPGATKAQQLAQCGKVSPDGAGSKD